MKIVIYVLCFFVGTALNMMLGRVFGVRLGALLLFVLLLSIASWLCRKWDERKESFRSEYTANSSDKDCEGDRV